MSDDRIPGGGPVVEPPDLLLCGLADIPDGHSRGFDPHGVGYDTIFVVRYAGTVYGYRNSCPHIDGARMAWRKDEYLNQSRSRIVCAAHGAVFRIEDDVCEMGPCLGQKLASVRLQSINDCILLLDATR